MVPRVQRRIGTGAGLIFKGSGFYTTDYRSESYKNAAKAEKEASGGKDKASEKSKTDKSDSSKPASKPDMPSPSGDATGRHKPQATVS